MADGRDLEEFTVGEAIRLNQHPLPSDAHDAATPTQRAVLGSLVFSFERTL
jgi:hypothetical protein